MRVRVRVRARVKGAGAGAGAGDARSRKHAPESAATRANPSLLSHASVVGMSAAPTLRVVVSKVKPVPALPAAAMARASSMTISHSAAEKSGEVVSKMRGSSPSLSGEGEGKGEGGGEGEGGFGGGVKVKVRVKGEG